MTDNTDTTDTTDTTEEGIGLIANIRTPEMEMAETGAGVPAAADLAIEDINPANPHLFKEDRWHDHFARLRAEDPVHFNELETAGRYWSITKYDDVHDVDGDWKTFSSAPGISLGVRRDPDAEDPLRRVVSFIAMDPPEHTEQRKTVRSVSAPSNLRNVEPLIRERTIDVLESLPEGETFDWVDTVSIELTTLMLATLFDFPLEDRRKLTRWSDIVFAVPEPGGIVETQQQKIDEMMECVAYFERLWEERRENPGFDLVSMLVHGEATKDMPTLEHLGNLLLLIVGGNDTTRNTMSGSVYGLNKFPDQYDKLIADPGLVQNMVPEIIRWQTPLPYMRRTATKDCEIRDKKILEGDQILMWYISANRDEDVFENAEDLDIERPNADRHLSFGYGIHFCMGSRLAELQLRVLWEEVLARFERIEVQEEPERTFSSFVHGYTNLPVTVTRR
ncbi:MAG TPA: cytochrome P450 [Acidimicrobiales bacterium]|nr:cytochrome P450 [Acidimicrobiales bacterium]